FETGAMTFLDWLDTERTYLQTRLAYYQAQTDFYKSIALLQQFVGGSFERSSHE
ncbi:MAG: TolC family protein, partial [Candidatus Omnitrophica bacterium]|nr:TolC family protein [Candidatus Omnitrophota bacterium]